MLTLIAISAAMILQDHPASATAAPEARTQVFIRSGDGPGSLDKDGDGQVSREEFSAPMNDHFSRMDKDADGRLSAEELGVGHGQSGDHEIMILGGPGGPGGPGVHRFEMRRPHAEGEGGAGVEHQERIVILGAGSPGGSPRTTWRLHDGGPGRQVEIRRMGGDEGDELDADKDGRISEAEFTSVLREAFGRMDKDGSGFIEPAERGGDGDVRVFMHRMDATGR